MEDSRSVAGVIRGLTAPARRDERKKAGAARATPAGIANFNRANTISEFARLFAD